MTHPIAALIAGVPHYEVSPVFGEKGNPDGIWLRHADVLAALEAATPPDLVALSQEAEKFLAWDAPEAEIKDDLAQAADTIRALIALATAQAAQIAGLSDELHTMKTAGVIEVAVRNPSVSDYMRHWEARAEAAEAKVAELEAEAVVKEQAHIAVCNLAAELDTEAATLRAEVERLRGALGELIDHTHNCERELTEELHKVDFCGESLPLTNARAALEGKNV